MNNKRRHKRFSVTGSAELTYADGEGIHTIHTLISDVSLSGIGLYVDLPLEEDLDVSLRIRFISFDGAMKTDTVEGHIVYSKEMNDVYFMGIEFSGEIDPEHQPSLHAHMHSILVRDSEAG